MSKELWAVPVLCMTALILAGSMAIAAEPVPSDGALAVPWAATDAGPPSLRAQLDPRLGQADNSAPAPAEPAPGVFDTAIEGTRRAVDTAQELKRSFEQQLLGQSITVGVADVSTGALLTTSAGTFESYTGPDLYTPAVAFNSASAHGFVVKEYDAAGIHWLDTFNFVANYAQFSADKQTVQKLTGGQSPAGFVRGDFVYGVALLGYSGIHEGERVNFAFRAGVGLGAALARFDGRIDYSARGQNYTENFSNGYDQPLLAYLELIEARIGPIVVGLQNIELLGYVRTDKTNNRFLVQAGLFTFQVGYAFYF